MISLADRPAVHWQLLDLLNRGEGRRPVAWPTFVQIMPTSRQHMLTCVARFLLEVRLGNRVMLPSEVDVLNWGDTNATARLGHAGLHAVQGGEYRVRDLLRSRNGRYPIRLLMARIPMAPSYPLSMVQGGDIQLVDERGAEVARYGVGAVDVVARHDVFAVLTRQGANKLSKTTA